MKQEKNLKLNAVMNAVLTMSSFLFSLITYPYAARVLLPQGTGRVLFVHSLITYFNMFAQLGIPVYGIRACAAVRDDHEALTRTAQELLLLNFLMSILSYASLAAGIVLIPRLRTEKTLIVLMSACLFLSMIGMEWLYMAMENYTFMAIRSVIFKLAALALMFVIVRTEEHVLGYGIVLTIALYGHFILNFIYVRRYVSLRPRKGLNLKRHLKPVLTFFLMSCAVTIYTNLDTLMLGFMKGDTETGYYGTASKIKTALSALVTSLGSVLLPRASYFVQHKRFDEFREMTEKALGMVFLVAPALAVYFVLYAREGILLISGADYLPAVFPMQVLMPTLVMIGITNILGIQILVPLGREKAVFLSEAGGAVTDLVLNFLLIPRFASAGAALATVAAELVVMIIQMAALRKELLRLFSGIPYHKIIAAILVSALAAWGFRYFSWHSFIILFASAAVFFGVYLSLLKLLKVGAFVGFLAEIRAKLKREG